MSIHNLQIYIFFLKKYKWNEGKFHVFFFPLTAYITFDGNARHSKTFVDLM